MGLKKCGTAILNFYIDGFRNMTWGKQLWLLIILKAIILFCVLRLFFFKPILSDKTEEEKIEYVGTELLKTRGNN